MNKYTVWLTDIAGNILAPIEMYQKLELTSRFNAVGKFLLQMPYGSEATQLAGYKTALRVERSEIGSMSLPEVIFRGRIRKWHRVRSKRENYFELSGVDENSILEETLALPVPLGPPYSLHEYDVKTGIAGSIMLAYVEANLGGIARTDRRQISTAPDYAYGANLTDQTRFEKLIDLLKRLSVAGGGLGFRVINGVFQVYMPETRAISFSIELGNISGYEYVEEAPTGNYFFLGGSGEGTARSFWEACDNISINRFGRIEQFINRSDIDTADKANVAIGDAIGQNADKNSIKLTVTECEGARYLENYYLDDRVYVEVDGFSLTDVIREATIKLDGRNGETVNITVGNSDNYRIDAISNQMANMSKSNSRIGRLEAR